MATQAVAALPALVVQDLTTTLQEHRQIMRQEVVGVRGKQRMVRLAAVPLVQGMSLLQMVEAVEGVLVKTAVMVA